MAVFTTIFNAIFPDNKSTNLTERITAIPVNGNIIGSICQCSGNSQRNIDRTSDDNAGSRIRQLKFYSTRTAGIATTELCRNQIRGIAIFNSIVDLENGGGLCRTIATNGRFNLCILVFNNRSVHPLAVVAAILMRQCIAFHIKIKRACITNTVSAFSKKC